MLPVIPRTFCHPCQGATQDNIHLLAINPRNTSRTCPACGHISSDNRLTQSRFEYVECGYENNADNVGVLNIMAAEHAALACGEMMRSGHSVKRESTEAIKLGLALV